MVIQIPPAANEAMRDRHTQPRDFIRISARSRDESDNNLYHEAYWSDIDPIFAEVQDPDTGGTRRYTFFGAGELVGIEGIPRVANLTIQTVRVRLSTVVDRVNDLIRYYEPKFAPVTIWRGFLSAPGVLVAPAMIRFVGVINDIDIQIPEFGGEGYVDLELRSQVFELTRTSPSMRSDEDQRRERSESDNFFQDVVVAPHWQGVWGGDKRPPRTEGRRGGRNNRD